MKRIATVDEQPAAGDKRSAESEQGERSRPGMTPVESADPHGEGDVVALLSRVELELLSRDLADGQTPGADQVCGRLGELGDRLGRAVDGEHVAGRTNSVGDLASSRPWSAADLDHPEARQERQRIDDGVQSGGQRTHAT